VAEQRFGRLVVVADAPSTANGRYVEVLCDCGTRKTARLADLRRSKIVSCGCAQRERVALLKASHGHASGGTTPTYVTWKAVIARCSNENNPNWGKYGGRGIGICQRWRSSFDSFLEDMGERPPGTSIDRIDVNGSYEPGNCRWATTEAQNQNRRSTRLTPDIVNEIRGRFEHGESRASIVARMVVPLANVTDVIARRTWRNVP
jgi:hypothetical protein